MTEPASLPLNFTLETPVKPVPVMTTFVLTGPDLGVKVVIVGSTRKLVVLIAAPPGVVTEILPVVAPEGTVAVIFVEELRLNVAASPLN